MVLKTVAIASIRLVIRAIRSLKRAIRVEWLLHYITEESGRTPHAPVGRIIKLRVRPGTHEAEEGMLLGIDDDAYMAAPNNQVARLWCSHSREICVANIEFARSR